MAWALLVLAGVLEVIWAIGLKETQGFRRPLSTAVVVVALAGSIFLLGRATQHIPIGTAYTVWVGIGAAGAVLFGIVLFDEPATPARLACLALLVASVVGLQLTGS